ncbi:hypothetical protein BQ8420_27730 [Nocardiopsis sp. JB363]|nr:hypothetical protein BQ8420_27730 [Nocardiopsis sp. JB363]
MLRGIRRRIRSEAVQVLPWSRVEINPFSAAGRGSLFYCT